MLCTRRSSAGSPVRPVVATIHRLSSTQLKAMSLQTFSICTRLCHQDESFQSSHPLLSQLLLAFVHSGHPPPLALHHPPHPPRHHPTPHRPHPIRPPRPAQKVHPRTRHRPRRPAQLSPTPEPPQRPPLLHPPARLERRQRVERVDDGRADEREAGRGCVQGERGG